MQYNFEINPIPYRGQHKKNINYYLAKVIKNHYKKARGCKRYFMKNQIKLEANALEGDKMQVVLTFDRSILLKDKLEGEHQLLYVFTHELSTVTDHALLMNYDFLNMATASNAIN